MKFTATVLVAACLIALVSSIPVPESEGLQSRDVNPEAENQVAQDGDQAGSENNEVRVQFDDQGTSANEAVQSELAPLEEIEVSDDENRNKRFLNFGFGGNNGGTGGSAGGSGNFLFDIIRQAADGAARAAGTVYRVVAGTQSLGLGLSASRDLGPSPPPQTQAAPAAQAPAPANAPPPAPAAPAPAPAPAAVQPPLVAGSGSATQSSQPGNAPDPNAGRQDAIQEAVPGPVTRLFVIANRGLSNLIQDLILRLAATSERIVNFKARLITSII
ncbi:translation initiation factor IF-2 isoform X2 [Diachasmimorpha longicaudata]|uniref:translation initiation factor IF-2 isoform X2 n=1 Tax=Diachasmimorpha longicaudata TaxID=58733 RepID=UPI0030B8D33E